MSLLYSSGVYIGDEINSACTRGTGGASEPDSRDWSPIQIGIIRGYTTRILICCPPAIMNLSVVLSLRGTFSQCVD